MAEFKDFKIAEADFAQKDIASIEENVVSGRADWLKAQFDKASKEVLAPKINGLIDNLEGTEGAKNIGAEPLAPGGVQTVGGPVSYTHLDVYKRQGLHCEGGDHYFAVQHCRSAHADIRLELPGGRDIRFLHSGLYRRALRLPAGTHCGRSQLAACSGGCHRLYCEGKCCGNPGSLLCWAGKFD